VHLPADHRNLALLGLELLELGPEALHVWTTNDKHVSDIGVPAAELEIGSPGAGSRYNTPVRSRPVPGLLAAGSIAVLVLPGCGGRAGAQRTTLQRGRAVFASACANCHTAIGRDSRAPGGDLAVAKLSERDIASFVRVMPVRLSQADVHAVSAYVHAAAAGKR
jgi:hypothetical protein